MFFDPALPPDSQDQDEAWAALDLSGAVYDEPPEVAEARSRAAFEAPDTLDHLIEIADMATMQAAQKLTGVNVLRREAMVDAARHGRTINDVVERSVRLEIAAALRITESEAAGMLALGEALVEEFPTVLESFASARMTERHARLLVESLQELEPEFHDQILSTAIELAETEPVGAFRRSLRALLGTVRAETLAQRHIHAVQRRRVLMRVDVRRLRAVAGCVLPRRVRIPQHSSWTGPPHQLGRTPLGHLSYLGAEDNEDVSMRGRSACSAQWSAYG